MKVAADAIKEQKLQATGKEHQGIRLVWAPDRTGGQQLDRIKLGYGCYSGTPVLSNKEEIYLYKHHEEFMFGNIP